MQCAGFFLTKIFHPNVSKPGEICVNVLKRDWKPDMGLRHVLVIVRCLLIEPFPGAHSSHARHTIDLHNWVSYGRPCCILTQLHAAGPLIWAYQEHGLSW